MTNRRDHKVGYFTYLGFLFFTLMLIHCTGDPMRQVGGPDVQVSLETEPLKQDTASMPESEEKAAEQPQAMVPPSMDQKSEDKTGNGYNGGKGDDDKGYPSTSQCMDRFRAARDSVMAAQNDHCGLVDVGKLAQLSVSQSSEKPILSVEMCVRLPGQTFDYPLVKSLDLRKEYANSSDLTLLLTSLKEYYGKGNRYGNLMVDIAVCDDKNGSGRCSDEELRCQLTVPGPSLVSGKYPQMLHVSFTDEGAVYDLDYLIKFLKR